MDKNSANHPVVYLGIIVVCTLLGGLIGYYDLGFGARGLLTTGGVILGSCFGLGLALLWRLLMSLADL